MASVLPVDVRDEILERFDYVPRFDCWLLRKATKGPVAGLTFAIHHQGLTTEEVIRLARAQGSRL